MTKNVYFLIDKKNNYLDQEYLAHTHDYYIIYTIYTLFAVYWIHSFYYKNLSKVSIIIGILSLLLFITLFDFLSNYKIVVDPTNNAWINYESDYNGEFITDLSKTLKNLELNSTGLVVNKNYLNKLRKQKIELVKSNKISEQKENINDKGILYQELLSKNISYKGNSITFQGYCLINVLFTILSLMWNINKNLFNKILNDFLHATVLSVPISFIWFWHYKKGDALSEYNIKTLILFQAISITLAMLTEIFIVYTK